MAGEGEDKEENTDIKANYKEEYIILLDLLARVNDANKGFSAADIKDGERLWSAHNLANKFIEHALTILYLSHSTIIQDLPSFSEHRFIDVASIDVLTRAAMEAFLVFHYVFFEPYADEEKNYRHWCYEAAGITEVLDFPAYAEEHKEALIAEGEKLVGLKAKLKSSRVFQALPPNQQKKILKGQWRLKTWSDIAASAGFGKMLAKHIYRYLCGNAHSSNPSILRIRQALVKGEAEQLIQSSIDTMKILIANMIREYCGLFPKAQDILKRSGANKFVDAWIDIGHQLGET